MKSPDTLGTMQDFEVILSDTPDTLRVLEGKNRVNLFAAEDIDIYPEQVKFYIYPCGISLSEDVVGVCFFDRRLKTHSLDLYYPESFILDKDSKRLSVPLKNNTDATVHICSREYICSVNFMSVQFFNLTRRHDGSDRGLQSKKIIFRKREDGNRTKRNSDV